MNMKRIGSAAAVGTAMVLGGGGARVRAEPAAPVVAAPGQTLVLPAVVTPAALPPGAVLKVQFNWQADGPLKHANQVFLHFIGSKHGVAYTENHMPDVPTDSVNWKGKISYSSSIKIPATMAADTYQLAIGFYTPADKDKSDIQALASGEGVSALPGGGWYAVGTVTIDPNAPTPKAATEGAKTLDLSDYKMVFNENFAAPLDVSPWGPATRWIAHTPWNGDFGDAKFVDPEDGFPFTIDKGILRIEARKDLGKNDPVQATLWVDDVTVVAGTKTKVLNDFEAESKDWTYNGGVEFPGAKGSFARDATVAHGGQASGKLEADFAGGGSYVGTLRDLSTLDLPDATEFRFWAKGKDLRSLSVRLIDATGQCHQKIGIPLAAGNDWQEVVLKIDGIVGGEHWGGANDGKWHGPAKSLGLNIDRRDLRTADQWGRKWRGGCLASCDGDGKGFAQKYGYFECRAKMPAGAGVWPAFWLFSTPPEPAAGVDVRKSNSWESWMKRFDVAKLGAMEIDVIEFYGHDPSVYNATSTVWRPEPHRSTMCRVFTKPNEVSDGFHNYGAMVSPDFITMYFDGVEVWKTRTPPEHQRPLMMLLNLALGSGWPIDKVPNPSYMYVEYVRAYAKAGASMP